MTNLNTLKMAFKMTIGIIYNRGFIAFFKNRDNCCFFHAAGNDCVDKLRLKINFSKEAKIVGQPFTTKLGVAFNPIDFVDCNRFIALLTSSLTKALANVSLHNKNGDGRCQEYYCKYTKNA
jgi:hypothetical protein